MQTSRLLLLFAVAISAPAQVVSFGLKGGIPFTSASYQTNSYVQTGRWTVGPMLDVRLGAGFSIEVDALYRSYKLTGQNLLYLTSDSNPTVFFYQYDLKAWDFPFLLKYRFLKRKSRPFVSVGPGFTHETLDGTIQCLGPGCTAISSAGALVYPSRFTGSSNRPSFVTGGGMEFQYGRVKLSPEFRYSRFYRPNGNQAVLLLGITF